MDSNLKKYITAWFNIKQTKYQKLLNFPFSNRAFHRLILKSPLIGFTLCRIVGSIAYRLSYGPRPHHLKKVLKERSKNDLEAVALQMTINYYFSQLINIMGEYKGLDYLANRIKIHNSKHILYLQRSNRPAIITVAHIGAPLISLAGIHHLGIPILALKRSVHFNCPPQIEIVETRANSDKKTFALKRAIDYLKTGGIVFLAFDGGSGKNGPYEIEFLGRQLSYPAGIALMSQLTGAPVIPMHATWPSGKGRFDVHIHPPIERRCNVEEKETLNRELITESARLFENEILKNPCLLRPGFLYKLLSMPKPGEDAK